MDLNDEVIKRYGLDQFIIESTDLVRHEVDIPTDMRRTSDVMSLTEYARIKGIRAKQIEDGAPIYIRVTTETTAAEIAATEISQKKCPLNIKRALGNGYVETWAVNELALPFD
jgi:DNA-directed RNA polymerase subunit K/omega